MARSTLTSGTLIWRWNTNFQGGARAAKWQFFGKNLPKVPKNASFGLFLQNFACGAEVSATTGSFSALGELRKSIWSN